MEVKSAPKFTKEYLPDRAKELGITVPDGYEEISAE
jgi:putative ABC transport system substrate-binding protein